MSFSDGGKGNVQGCLVEKRKCINVEKIHLRDKKTYRDKIRRMEKFLNFMITSASFNIFSSSFFNRSYWRNLNLFVIRKKTSTRQTYEKTL